MSAVWLANIADTLADTTGLGRTFVGSIFLAFCTSLPEIVVSVSAIKLGSLDLALGNIFGSNMVNMFILSLCGFVPAQGPILKGVSHAHIFTIALSLVLTAFRVFGIRDKKKKTFLGLGWDSLLMLTAFIFGVRILYSMR